MATRQRTPNAMDLLLGAVPKPTSATTSLVEPMDGHAPPAVETAAPAESPVEAVESLAAAAENEAPAGETPAAATETAEPAAALVTGEPAPPQPRRSRRPAVAASAAPAVETVSTVSPPAVAAPAPASVVTAARRRRDPDEDLEPAYVPMKITVSIPAVVLSELIRTVHTIRRMTGQRQPVNQGSVIAAALEMAFEEFRTKGATSSLVDRLREE